MHKSDSSTFQFLDNRYEAVAQRKLQEMVNNSPQALQLRAFQNMANIISETGQTIQLLTNANSHPSQQKQSIRKKDNYTGLPDNLKFGIENLSGYSMDDVKVHYNSNKPAQLQAHAYTQGTEIHLGSGQEKHLPHEAWHVVQQKQGRVKPTLQMKGSINVNNDVGLEKEADVMGEKASYLELITTQLKSNHDINISVPSDSSVAQLKLIKILDEIVWNTKWSREDKKNKLKEKGFIPRSWVRGLKAEDEWNLANELLEEIKNEKLQEKAWNEKSDITEKRKIYRAYTIEERLALQEKLKLDVEELRLTHLFDLEQVPKSDTGSSSPAGKSPNNAVSILNVHFKSDINLLDKYVGFLAEVANRIGFTLIIWTTKKDEIKVTKQLTKFKSLKYKIRILSNERFSSWAEDSVEHLINGNVAILRKFETDDLEKGISLGRQARWPRGTQDLITKGYKVNQGKTGELKKEAVKAEDRNEVVGHIRSYIEGGNMITLETGLLIGKDSVSATSYAYNISSEMVIQIMAEDFGLKPSQIIPVEQPGKFHLDMGLMSIGNGVVIVNDSSEKLKLEQAKDNSNPKAIEKLTLICKLENQASEDLLASGIKVLRLNLEHHDDGDSESRYNFFNGEYVQGSDGKRHYITNGAAPELEARFYRFMVEEVKVVDEVHFAPREISIQSLKDEGGIGCRVKGQAIPLQNMSEVEKLAVSPSLDVALPKSIKNIGEIQIALKVMGISINNVDRLNRTYKVLALKYHPDKGGSHDEMTILNEAMAVLTNLGQEENSEKTLLVKY